MTGLGCAAGLLMAVGLSRGPGATARLRLGHVRRSGGQTEPDGRTDLLGRAAWGGRPGLSGSPARSRRRGARAAWVVAGLAVALLLGGPVGWSLGCLAAVAGPRLTARLEPAEQRARRRTLARELPTSLDLLAACLESGASPLDALGAVAAALPGPVGEAFGSVARTLALGVDARVAWRPMLDDVALGRLARAVLRAEASGAPLAAAIARTAADLRAARRVAATASARRVGVLAVAPLGLCFLPAFVLLGVVPVVWGLAATSFGLSAP